MAVRKGDKIKVEYEGKLEDGTVFDASERHGQPLEFEAGAGMMIKGFDDAVIGMNKGEEKEIVIEVKDAYGNYNPELIRKIPKEQFPPTEKELQPGMVVVIGTPNGMQFPIKIADVSGTDISVDMNHPLAGKKLKFRLKIVAISSRSK